MPARPAVGSARTPIALALGAHVDVGVDLDRAMPDAEYEVSVTPTGALIGGATLSVRSRTTTTVTVRVTALLLLATDQSFSVFAWPS